MNQGRCSTAMVEREKKYEQLWMLDQAKKKRPFSSIPVTASRTDVWLVFTGIEKEDLKYWKSDWCL